ncbi:uncharacterized protein [Coffea arabica]|uniref:RNase H type-1 domain-containing protein n=1 Tax=Coffea arabica TaxID=13443 RepID=A0ABM4VSS4_COFAR
MSDVLRKFGIHGPSRCHCCAVPYEEGLDHIFCTGDVATEVWSSFEDPGEMGRVSNLRHRVLQWWLRCGQNVYLKFVYRLLPMLTCWELWKARNKGVFEGRRMVGIEVVRQVFHQLRDLFHGQFPEITFSSGSWEGFYSSLLALRRRMSILLVRWMAPTVGCKLNSDGCTRGNPGVNGGGGVVRDSEGQVIVGYSCFFGSLTSLHAELKAMAFGVQLCVTHGLHDLHIEADSLVLVEILQGKLGCPWRLQWELEGLLRYKRHFREITHCYREANKPANFLANLGADTELETIYGSHSELPVRVRGEIQMEQL